MPRYYFDIDDGMEHLDDVGRDVGTHEALRREAMSILGDRIAREGEKDVGYSLVMRVRNAAGGTVFTLRSVCQIDEPTDQTLQLALSSTQ